jgi:hypothetical protein
MQAAKAPSNTKLENSAVNSGERFLASIRLFLAFKRGSGQDTIRDEFLLDSLVEMRERLYGRKEPSEVVSASQIHIGFGQEILGY